MKIWATYIMFLFIVAHSGVFAQQEFSTYREKWVQTKDTVVVDSLSIQPSSILVHDVDSSLYKVLPFRSKLLFFPGAPDSVKVTYNVFALNLAAKVFLRDENDTLPDVKLNLTTLNPYNFSQQELKREDLFGGESLRKGGSISRGVRVGNNQDLSINSNMNLELSGTFQGVEIVAAITDNNIPIQPQGNTQTLQEFDKVFVQFSKDGHQLIAGDFQIEEREDAFLRFNKKAQGLSYQGIYKTSLFGEDAVYKVNTSAALSRGKFSRNQIIGVEGNQGPYQLTGAENEQFIIVLSGTEKIYVDGKLMKRGMDNDYTIDYNSSEVTFTTNQLITKDKRIIIEFQYSDQNYGRSLFQAGNEIASKKGKFFFNLYSEQDMKFQQLQQSLSETNLDLLYDVGDSLHLAITPRIDSVEYNVNQVLYKKADTLESAVPYSFYKQSNNPDSAFYALSFSNVGKGNGNYVQSTSTANGRVYQWVAPISGVPQGEYEPLVRLVAPKQQQMATIGTKYQITKNSSVFVEGAFSNNNQNLFSDKHKTDNQGIAVSTKLNNQYPFSGKKNNYLVKTDISYQLVNKHFNRIERFRTTEFERDFNLKTEISPVDEHIIGWNSDLFKNGKDVFGIQSSYISRGVDYTGLKSGAHANLPLWKGAKFTSSGSYLSSEGSVQYSEFFRHKVNVEQQIKTLTLLVFEEQENNQVFQNEIDTLLVTSFNYQVFGAGINWQARERLNIGVTGNQRIDYLPLSNALQKTTSANNISAKLVWQGKRSSRFLWNTTYRELKISNDKLTSQQPENTFLNRIEYGFELWKGMVQSNSFFETGSGTELKRQYVYVAVNPGQGTHMWNDFNNDSIQDINEFEIPPDGFSDQASYVRVFLPSTDFIKTFSNQFNQSFNISPAKFVDREKKMGKLLSRFHNQTILKLSQKNAKETSEQFQIPFNSSISDTNLISISSSVRNTLYFNRSNPKYGVNYTYSKNEDKSLLFNGFDGRAIELHALDFRWNFLRKFTFTNKFETSEKQRTSQSSTYPDYKIGILAVEPTIAFQKGSSFRVKVKGEWKEKANQEGLGGETATFSKIGGEVTYNMLNKGRMSFQINYIETTFSGELGTNSPLVFDMLEGFQQGTNFTWQTRYQRSFKNNFQVNLQYEGRSSETSQVVHTGTMQVQLIF